MLTNFVNKEFVANGQDTVLERNVENKIELVIMLKPLFVEELNQNVL